MAISSVAWRCKRPVVLLCAVVASLFLTSVTHASATDGAYDGASSESSGPVTIPQPRVGVQAEFRIHNYNARGKCIGIANGLAGDWDCTSNPDQTWHWGEANKEGWRELVNGEGKCLAVNGGSTDAGARILGYACVKSSDQYWEFWSTPPWDGWSTLMNYKGWIWGSSGWAVGVAGGSTANGAALVLWSSEGHADQIWLGS
jgi:hypothetical protein